MRRVLTSLGILSLIVIAGCGGSDHRTAREVAQDYVNALTHRDATEICALYSDEYRHQLARFYSSCESFYALVLLAALLVFGGCGGGSHPQALRPQALLFRQIRACLTKAGLQTQPLGLSTNSHIALKAIEVGLQRHPRVDLIILAPGD